MEQSLIFYQRADFFISSCCFCLQIHVITTVVQRKRHAALNMATQCVCPSTTAHAGRGVIHTTTPLMATALTSRARVCIS